MFVLLFADCLFAVGFADAREVPRSAAQNGLFAGQISDAWFWLSASAAVLACSFFIVAAWWLCSSCCCPHLDKYNEVRFLFLFCVVFVWAHAPLQPSFAPERDKYMTIADDGLLPSPVDPFRGQGSRIDRAQLRAAGYGTHFACVRC